MIASNIENQLHKRAPNYGMLDFLIIGAQKCGTTSLYNYLVQHPQIVPALQKEVHFFDFNFDKGLDWYFGQFPNYNPADNLITGEASPYYIFHPLVAKRVHQLFPKVKLIVLLRNPVERAISHYYHEVRLGCEPLCLEEAIASEPIRLQGETEKLIADGTYYSFNHQHYTYLSRGIYVDQLQSWFNLFPREQFLILKSEDLYANPAQVLNKVLEFLEVSPYQLPK
jgi:Sulfotransferase domain